MGIAKELGIAPEVAAKFVGFEIYDNKNKNELQKHFFDGMSILVGGFMAVGTPETIIDEIVNLDIIQEIVTKYDLKIEIGGGVRNFESIQKYTDAGVEKVILGSAAIKDKSFLKVAVSFVSTMVMVES